MTGLVVDLYQNPLALDIDYVILYCCEGNVLRQHFLVPVNPPVRFEGGENCVFFWGGARLPAHFGDLELTGTKKCFPYRAEKL